MPICDWQDIGCFGFLPPVISNRSTTFLGNRMRTDLRFFLDHLDRAQLVAGATDSLYASGKNVIEDLVQLNLTFKTSFATDM